MVKSEKIFSGKRKTSVAKARVLAGDGKITINKLPHEFLPRFQKLLLEEPIRIARKVLGEFKYNLEVSVRGGGMESRIEASRLAIARALVEKTKSKDLKEAYLKYDKHLLVADIRRKEAYKPDDSKARAKRQSSKR
jgi:small subunit ribosomal protein S9